MQGGGRALQPCSIACRFSQRGKAPPRQQLLPLSGLPAIDAAPADSDSEGSEGPRAGASGSSSDEENADSNSRRRMRGGSSSQDEPVVGPRGLPLQETGSQPPDMLPRSASAAGRHSPPRLPAQLQHPQQQTGRPPGAACASPQRSQHAGSTAGPAGSSSYLPDAPPDSALEDTATAGGPRQPRGRRREGSVPPGTAAACSRFGWPSLQQQQQGEQLQQGERGADDEPLQRMRMLSLEAEGSAQRGHSAEEGDEDGPQDMIRSPAPVTSRPTPPGLPLPPSAAGQLDAGGMVLQGQQRGRAGGGGGGARRGAAAAAGARMVAQLVFEEAAQLALGERPQEEHHQEREQEQESSEGHSAGQASSAAHEPPKRQRRSGDLLPPLLEHSSQHRQHRPHPQQHVAPASPGAAAGAATPAGDRETDPRAAAAAHRAAILGSLRPWERPGQLDGQQQHGEDPAPAGALEAGSDAAGNGGGAGHGVCPDRQLLLPQQRGPLDAEGQQPEGGAGGGPPGEVSNATLRAPRAAHSGSSVWGSTLVCADLTVNDVASQYWPFLRSAMRGQVGAAQPGWTAPGSVTGRWPGAMLASLPAGRHAGLLWAAPGCDGVCRPRPPQPTPAPRPCAAPPRLGASQTATLQAVDKRLVAALVSALGETIFGKCLRRVHRVGALKLGWAALRQMRQPAVVPAAAPVPAQLNGPSGGATQPRRPVMACVAITQLEATRPASRSLPRPPRRCIHRGGRQRAAPPGRGEELGGGHRLRRLFPRAHRRHGVVGRLAGVTFAPPAGGSSWMLAALAACPADPPAPWGPATTQQLPCNNAAACLLLYHKNERDGIWTPLSVRALHSPMP